MLQCHYVTMLHGVTVLTGSLADREHRKWLESAVVLHNNPYSEESITRRQTELCSSFLETPRLHAGRRSDVTTSEQQQKIYCGLRSVNADRYNRDYFINNKNSDERLQSRDLSFTPEEVIDCDGVRTC